MLEKPIVYIVDKNINGTVDHFNSKFILRICNIYLHKICLNMPFYIKTYGNNIKYTIILANKLCTNMLLILKKFYWAGIWYDEML